MKRLSRQRVGDRLAIVTKKPMSKSSEIVFCFTNNRSEAIQSESLC
jgi:hypothetical protein